MNPFSIRTAALQAKAAVVAAVSGCGTEAVETVPDAPRTSPYLYVWAGAEQGDCAIPVTRGRWWVQTWTHASGSALISLDMSDPSAPVVVDELTLEERWWPHWISMEPEGDRIVVASGPGSTLYRVLMARLDPETGHLTWDATFREPGSDALGVSFERESWPHGSAGPALPHGTVFARPDH